MKGLVTGSFDPITLGHLDIIMRARSMCDELVVAVFNNEQKTYMFSLPERVKLVKLALSDSDIEVYGSDGMVIDFCRAHGIDMIIRGFRTAQDYAYETDMAIYNHTYGGVYTYLIPSSDIYSGVSGTQARKAIALGGALINYLPKKVAEYLGGKNDRL